MNIFLIATTYVHVTYSFDKYRRRIDARRRRTLIAQSSIVITSNNVVRYSYTLACT